MLAKFSSAAAAVLVLVAGLAMAGALEPSGADARFQKIYQTELQWRQEQFADDEDSQKPISDHLPKVDPASQAARLRYWEDVQHRLDEIPRASLSPKAGGLMSPMNSRISRSGIPICTRCGGSSRISLNCRFEQISCKSGSKTAMPCRTWFSAVCNISRLK